MVLAMGITHLGAPLIENDLHVQNFPELLQVERTEGSVPAKPLALHPELLAWGSVPGMGRGLPWGPDLGTPRVMQGRALVPPMADRTWECHPKFH